MTLVSQSKPILPEGAYQAAAEFVGLRQDASGAFRQSETLETCLGASFEEVAAASEIEFRKQEYHWREIKTSQLELPVSSHLPIEFVSANAGGDTLKPSEIILTPREFFWVVALKSHPTQNWELNIKAGFANWDNIPADVKIAVLELCQFHYDKAQGLASLWPMQALEPMQKLRAQIRVGFA